MVRIRYCSERARMAPDVLPEIGQFQGICADFIGVASSSTWSVGRRGGW